MAGNGGLNNRREGITFIKEELKKGDGKKLKNALGLDSKKGSLKGMGGFRERKGRAPRGVRGKKKKNPRST